MLSSKRCNDLSKFTKLKWQLPINDIYPRSQLFKINQTDISLCCFPFCISREELRTVDSWWHRLKGINWNVSIKMPGTESSEIFHTCCEVFYLRIIHGLNYSEVSLIHKRAKKHNATVWLKECRVKLYLETFLSSSYHFWPRIGAAS